MVTATMTTKGRVTVPKFLRDELKLSPGAKIEFVRVGPGEYSLSLTAPEGLAEETLGAKARAGSATAR
ncbi:AbrB family transcriptional regulator [Nocardioides marmorisolisilvae]|uniref:AbrB family transcriptional regulator n=2 Tax=Nocardioides marmorisolisilvae TaxID=1542737 RepID=A0A3N0DTT9_9ACTN|nr:AbrB family transcriptional regulator [Nocardioides marmorisolisilvae]